MPSHILAVIPSYVCRHKATGRTASPYGAAPWTGAKGDEEEDWESIQAGWTWLRADGTVGLGRKPAATYDEAVKVMEEINGRLAKSSEALRRAIERNKEEP